MLVVNSEKRTIEEKMDTLEYLLEKYSDYDAPLYGDGWGRNFRELTQNTLKKWKALLAARYENDGYVYMAELLEKGTDKGYGREWLVYLVTRTHNKTVILNATNYLKFDTLFYIITTLICILRNAMQGLGDHITPLISSGLEMVGKIVIAATLVPWLGYTGVIICEPIVWFIMVIPLLIRIFRMPVLRTAKKA